MKRLLIAFLISSGALLIAADKPDLRTRDKATLAKLQPLIGGWRGVGQLKRGSNDGAWIEQADWAWKFSDAGAALTFVAEKSKYFASGTLRPGSESGQFQLIAKPSGGGAEVTYVGSQAEDGQLVLSVSNTEKPPADLPDRISLRIVASGDRLVMLYERRSNISDRFTRLAEVGYTKKGSDFGQGGGQPECVVTGGLGTITVTYKGESYFVCCTGCRDMFQEDPVGVLADYRERKAAEKAKKKQ